jgi:hypothetical protein
MNASFYESEGKAVVRRLLRQACMTLGRDELTYLGMPEEDALDVRGLTGLIGNVICIDKVRHKLELARHRIANMHIRGEIYRCVDMWDYLRLQYPSEKLLADVAFLDFLGGSIQSADPFAKEIAGLRSYFARHAHDSFLNRSFILAWTFMPHDLGPQKYTRHLKECLFPEDMKLLGGYSGIEFRTLAIRMILRQLLRQHEMKAVLYEHLLYKQVMSTFILVFAKGEEPACSLHLGSPDDILKAPITEYDERRSTPVSRPLL